MLFRSPESGSEWAGLMRSPNRVINSLLRPFTQPSGTGALARRACEWPEFKQLMQDDYFHVIPDASDERSAGSVLARIYRDIGLAAVADALSVPTEGFEPDMMESLERGEFYLLPPAGALAQAGTDA